jgi:hypothetical protein
VDVLLDSFGAEHYTVAPVRIGVDTAPTLETLQASAAASTLAHESGVRVRYRAAKTLHALSALISYGGPAACDPWQPLRLPGLPLRAAPATRLLTPPQAPVAPVVMAEDDADTLPALPIITPPTPEQPEARIVPVLTPTRSPVMAL